MSDGATLDQALYVRDALSLETPDDALATPALLGPPPDRSHLLDGQSRVKVAQQ